MKHWWKRLRRNSGIGGRDFLSWLKVMALIAVLAVANWLLREERRYEVEGRAQVIDGDSLVVEGVEVRLQNVDAPEGRQLCKRKGRDWRCGEQATVRLRSRIGQRLVSCKGREYDKHGRLLGTCRLGKLDLNGWLVENGWAVSFGSYRRQERAAIAAKRGIWAGSFQRPQDWRRVNMRR